MLCHDITFTTELLKNGGWEDDSERGIQDILKVQKDTIFQKNIVT